MGGGLVNCRRNNEFRLLEAGRDPATVTNLAPQQNNAHENRASYLELQGLSRTKEDYQELPAAELGIAHSPFGTAYNPTLCSILAPTLKLLMKFERLERIGEYLTRFLKRTSQDALY